jgi:hypothetical protein
MHAVVELLGTKSGRDSASHKMDHFRSYRNYSVVPGNIIDSKAHTGGRDTHYLLSKKGDVSV